MRKEERTHASIFQKCTNEGSFRVLSEIDIDLIQTLYNIAMRDLKTVKKWSAQTGEKDEDWNIILKAGYDVLHCITEAFIYFDKIKVDRHECLFVHIIEKHPELDFDWNFLDRIRTVRNRSIYYGRPATYEDWKSIEFQLNLYINTLKKKVEEKLKETVP